LSFGHATGALVTQPPADTLHVDTPLQALVSFVHKALLGVRTQLPAALQLSAVQLMVSVQSRFSSHSTHSLLAHTPAAHAVPLVGWNVQPVVALQASAVQLLLSLHTSGGNVQPVVELHELVVQALLSLHTSGGLPQPVCTLQESVVHALPSLQFWANENRRVASQRFIVRPLHWSAPKLHGASQRVCAALHNSGVTQVSMRRQPSSKLRHCSKAAPVQRTVPGMQGSVHAPAPAELHCEAEPQFCSS
jgi:hypothetical protein